MTLYLDTRKIQSDLETADTNITALQGDMTTAQTAMSTMNSTMSTMGTDMTAVKSDIATLKTNVTALQTGLVTANGNIATNKTNITSNSGSITTLQGQMTTVNTNISTNTTSITALQGRATSLETRATLLEAFNAKTILTVVAGTNVTITFSRCFVQGKILYINMNGSFASGGVANNAIIATFSNAPTYTSNNNVQTTVLYNTLLALSLNPGIVYYNESTKQLRSGNSATLNNFFSISGTIDLP